MVLRYYNLLEGYDSMTDEELAVYKALQNESYESREDIAVHAAKIITRIRRDNIHLANNLQQCEARLNQLEKFREAFRQFIQTME